MGLLQRLPGAGPGGQLVHQTGGQGPFAGEQPASLQLAHFGGGELAAPGDAVHQALVDVLHQLPVVVPQVVAHCPQNEGLHRTLELAAADHVHLDPQHVQGIRQEHDGHGRRWHVQGAHVRHQHPVAEAGDLDLYGAGVLEVGVGLLPRPAELLDGTVQLCELREVDLRRPGQVEQDPLAAGIHRQAFDALQGRVEGLRPGCWPSQQDAEARRRLWLVQEHSGQPEQLDGRYRLLGLGGGVGRGLSHCRRWQEHAHGEKGHDGYGCTHRSSPVGLGEGSERGSDDPRWPVPGATRQPARRHPARTHRCPRC